MNAALVRPQIDVARRARITLIFFALFAILVGVLAANANASVLLMAAVLLLAFVAAVTVPIGSLPLVLATLVPFQFYFYVAGTNYVMRAAVVFLAAAVMRLLIVRGLRESLRGWVWIAPITVFLLAAFIAAFAAPDRYAALKGIYDWLPMVACLYVAAITVQSIQTVRQTIFILMVGGTLQAVLGLGEYLAGLDRVLGTLATPGIDLIMQPNLLQERLSELSFNWVLSGQALPFGTFINGIDYAIYLAAIFLLALSGGFLQRGRFRVAFWLSCALLIGVTILLTLKGSGFVAVVGGAVALSVCLLPTLSRRSLVVALAIVAIAIIVTMPFADSISQRAAFLIQREQGEFRDVGRLRIWLNLFSSYTQRPIFGYGLNNSELLSEPTRTLRAGAFAFNPTSPESSYVQTLIETGAVGFFALMSLFGVALVRDYRRARDGSNAALFAGLFASLVAILLGNLTVSGFTTDQNGMLMGVLIGLVFAEWKTP